MRVLGRGVAGAVDASTMAAVGAAVSLVMLVRLVAAALTVPAVFAQADPVGGLVAVGLGAAVAAVVLRWRDRILAGVRGWAVLFAVELAVDAAALALDGVRQPFLVQSIGTAALAGALWGAAGAGLGVALGMAASVLAVWTAAGPLPLATVVGLPSPYALVAVVFVVVRHVYREQLQLRGALRRSGEVAARTRERTRLARELHDSLAKTLVGIELAADGLRTGGSPAAEEIVGAARRALVEARMAIVDLRTDDDEGTDLGGAVVRTVTAWADAADVAAHVDLGPVDEPPPRVRVELVAVLREALFNVGRHAGARSVLVTLGRAGPELVLTVVDDGRGFDPATAGRRGHYGLIGMRERLASVGGRLDVASRPGAGTAVTVRVPAPA